MKTLFSALLFLSLAGVSQTTLYQNNFTNGNAGWNLQMGNAFNTWVVNNVYTCVDNTPNQGGGNYLHVYDDLSGDYCAVYVILGSGSGETVYATMTSGFSTVGQPAVTIQFDWLCQGQTGPLLASYGFVDYSTDGGNSWTNITSPVARYSGNPNWAAQTISSAQVPGILNQTDLRLRFGFTSSGYGTNPSFAIDNILITGNLSTEVAADIYPKDLIVFPNPSKGLFSIDLSSFPAGVDIEVLNVFGQGVQEYQNATGVFSADLSGLPAGIYTIRILTEGKQIMKFIVKE
ncbi:MAG: T9SS type A sorting domain-containing protein [Bacteroidia bacterium]|nr:T9SS type A sorting domain-containing protein [Bacteroidia bacterium]